MKNAVLKISALAVLGLALAVSTGSGAQPALVQVCALGPSSSFNVALATPPTPRAAALSQEVYRALCPGTCGSVSLVRNVSAPNAVTFASPGMPSVVHYSPEFLTLLETRFGRGAAFGVFAHELGHHIDINTPKPPWFDNAWGRELRADAFAGCALARAGLDPDALGRALNAMMRFPSPSHPGADLRIQAVRRGWRECGGSGILDVPHDIETENEERCRTERVTCTHPAHPDGDVAPCQHPMHPLGDQYPCSHVCQSAWGLGPCHPFDVRPCSHAAHPPHRGSCSHALHPAGDTERVCD